MRISIRIHMSIRMSIHMSIHMSMRMPTCMCIDVSMHMTIHTIQMSIPVYIHMSIHVHAYVYSQAPIGGRQAACSRSACNGIRQEAELRHCDTWRLRGRFVDLMPSQASDPKLWTLGTAPFIFFALEIQQRAQNPSRPPTNQQILRFSFCSEFCASSLSHL